MELKIGNHCSYLTVRPLKKGEKVSRTCSRHFSEGIVVDYDENGSIVGIEILTEVNPSYYRDYKENNHDK